MEKTDHFGQNEGDPDEDDEMSLEDTLREQERLAAVDTSIRETIQAMKGGRENVAQRFYRQDGSGTREDSTHPLDILKAGRKRILDKVISQNREQSVLQGERETTSDNESIRSLNRQLYEKLDALTGNIQEASHRNTIEIEIQTLLKAYQSALHKILTPLRFNRRGLIPRDRF